jgi:hypothetical protein
MTGLSDMSRETQAAEAAGPAAVALDWRGLVRVGGTDAHGFLQNLLTCDLDKVDETDSGYGALLTPQGKILFDFLVVSHAGGYLIEAHADQIADLARRLGFYRLRAKVEIADVSDEWRLFAVWGEAPVAGGSLAVSDPRLPDFGSRLYLPSQDATLPAGLAVLPASTYHARRIAFGLPESPFDFSPGDSFPHDADMDDLNGVAFDKGCFVGQEVVSRMRHRGTARRRVIKVSSDMPLPPSGTEISAGGKPAGTLGTVDGTQGLALVRLDRIAAAKARGDAIAADGVALDFALPAFARFDWPQPAGSEDEA